MGIEYRGVLMAMFRTTVREFLESAISSCWHRYIQSINYRFWWYIWVSLGESSFDYDFRNLFFSSHSHTNLIFYLPHFIALFNCYLFYDCSHESLYILFFPFSLVSVCLCFYLRLLCFFYGLSLCFSGGFHLFSSSMTFQSALLCVFMTIALLNFAFESVSSYQHSLNHASDKFIVPFQGRSDYMGYYFIALI